MKWMGSGLRGVTLGRIDAFKTARPAFEFLQKRRVF
jgi:hypothetical protein